MRMCQPIHAAGSQRGLAVLLAGVILGGCAPTTRVVLLPQGSAQTAVEVRSAGGTVLLDAPFKTAEVARGGTLALKQSDAATEQARYGALLNVALAPPQQFMLLFNSGGAELTDESRMQLAHIVQAARARAGGELLVSGHTDTMGAVAANDALSLQRAQAVRALLVEHGFAAERIEAIGRGSRQLLVPTADQVDEPRNRRVEVTLR